MFFRKKQQCSIPLHWRGLLEEHLRHHKLPDLQVNNLKEIKFKTRSFYTSERNTDRRCSSFCTYIYKGYTRVGQISEIWFFPEINKILICIRFICKTKSGKLYYRVPNNEAPRFHIIDALNLLDQMIVCTIGKHVFVSECEGLTFTVSAHPDDEKYPIDRENEELSEFIRDQVKIWLK